MKNRKLFLRWAWLPSMTFVGAIIMANRGWFTMVYESDVSHLSQVIALVFLVGTLLAGKMAWRISGPGLVVDAKRHDACAWVRRSMRHAPFLRGLCERLGLLGTLIGVAFMLDGGFSGVVEGGDAAQAALRALTTNMATAIYTTLVGYACSILLWFQFHLIGFALEDIES